MGKPTHTTSFKTLAQIEGHDTPAGVVLHGFWQKKRGRNPSMPYGGERNPRKAFDLAIEDIGLTPDVITGVFLREQFDESYPFDGELSVITSLLADEDFGFLGW